MKVIISNKAWLDIASIFEYIRDVLENHSATDKTVEKIIAKIEHLETFPNMGQTVETATGLPTSYRVLYVENYLIFYVTTNTKIIIHRILYARRSFLDILFDNHDEVNPKN
ncbi:MAG: type II toxin-antitoxin system RelE/ParE family toxin [Candidatus Nomurabacteria bacterium]|jgi:plasmid stabilization system protein ParE|nr:type II toxin-antitoxin system RelE/ParE family toxin [Candidatus Nomurabacteria bacterium]